MHIALLIITVSTQTNVQAIIDQPEPAILHDRAFIRLNKKKRVSWTIILFITAHGGATQVIERLHPLSINIVYAHSVGTIWVWSLFRSTQAKESVQEQFKCRENSRNYGMYHVHHESPTSCRYTIMPQRSHQAISYHRCYYPIHMGKG